MTDHVPHFLVIPVSCFFSETLFSPFFGVGGGYNLASGHMANVSVDQQTNEPFCLTPDCTKMHFLTGRHGTSLHRSLSRSLVLCCLKINISIYFSHYPWVMSVSENQQLKNQRPVDFSETHTWISCIETLDVMFHHNMQHMCSRVVFACLVYFPKSSSWTFSAVRLMVIFIQKKKKQETEKPTPG